MRNDARMISTRPRPTPNPTPSPIRRVRLGLELIVVLDVATAGERGVEPGEALAFAADSGAGTSVAL